MSQAIKTHDRDKWNDCSFALHRRCINCLAIVGRAFLSLFSLLSPLPWFPLFSSNSRVIETHGFCRFWFASTLLNSSGNESLRTVLFFLNDRRRKFSLLRVGERMAPATPRSNDKTYPRYDSDDEVVSQRRGSWRTRRVAIQNGLFLNGLVAATGMSSVFRFNAR